VNPQCRAPSIGQKGVGGRASRRASVAGVASAGSGGTFLPGPWTAIVNEGRDGETYRIV
jgi:hypothetical protein